MILNGLPTDCGANRSYLIDFKRDQEIKRERIAKSRNSCNQLYFYSTSSLQSKLEEAPKCI